MRPKRVSIGDLRDKCEVFRVTGSSRDVYGNIDSSLVSQGVVFLNVTSKMKIRETSEGSLQYYKEFTIIGRVGSFHQGDEVRFGTDRISIIAIDDANTGMIKGIGQYVG